MLLRMLLVSFCLFLGSFFNEQFQGLRFSYCWNIAVKADTVTVFYNVLACVCSIMLGAEVWTEYNRYVSLLFLVSPDITEQWLLVPIAALNIFEVCYWLFIAGLLSVKQVGVKFSVALRYTMSTYGVGYLFYIVFLMFLMLYLV